MELILLEQKIEEDTIDSQYDDILSAFESDPSLDVNSLIDEAVRDATIGIRSERMQHMERVGISVKAEKSTFQTVPAHKGINKTRQYANQMRETMRQSSIRMESRMEQLTNKIGTINRVIQRSMNEIQEEIEDSIHGLKNNFTRQLIRNQRKTHQEIKRQTGLIQRDLTDQRNNMSKLRKDFDEQAKASNKMTAALKDEQDKAAKEREDLSRETADHGQRLDNLEAELDQLKKKVRQQKEEYEGMIKDLKNKNIDEIANIKAILATKADKSSLDALRKDANRMFNEAKTSAQKAAAEAQKNAIDEMEEKMNNALKDVNDRLDQHEKRLNEAEAQLRDIKIDIDSLGNRVDSLEKRMAAVEGMLGIGGGWAMSIINISNIMIQLGKSDSSWKQSLDAANIKSDSVGLPTLEQSLKLIYQLVKNRIIPGNKDGTEPIEEDKKFDINDLYCFWSFPGPYLSNSEWYNKFNKHKDETLGGSWVLFYNNPHDDNKSDLEGRYYTSFVKKNTITREYLNQLKRNDNTKDGAWVEAGFDSTLGWCNSKHFGKVEFNDSGNIELTKMIENIVRGDEINDIGVLGMSDTNNNRIIKLLHGFDKGVVAYFIPTCFDSGGFGESGLRELNPAALENNGIADDKFIKGKQEPLPECLQLDTRPFEDGGNTNCIEGQSNLSVSYFNPMYLYKNRWEKHITDEGIPDKESKIIPTLSSIVEDFFKFTFKKPEGDGVQNDQVRYLGISHCLPYVHKVNELSTSSNLEHRNKATEIIYRNTMSYLSNGTSGPGDKEVSFESGKQVDVYFKYTGSQKWDTDDILPNRISDKKTYYEVKEMLFDAASGKFSGGSVSNNTTIKFKINKPIYNKSRLYNKTLKSKSKFVNKMSKKKN